MTMDQAVALAKRTGNTDLMRQLEAPHTKPGICVSGAATGLRAEKGTIPRKAARTREMSGTEREYHAILKRRWTGCEITWEKYTLNLAPGCRYKPDFCVTSAQGQLIFYEVKGKFLFKGAHASATATSLTKPKVAAEMFRHTFIIAQKIDGKWFEKTLPGKIDT